MDDLEAVLCLSLLHPLNTLGDAAPGTSYYDIVRYSETIERPAFLHLRVLLQPQPEVAS